MPILFDPFGDRFKRTPWKQSNVTIQRRLFAQTLPSFQCQVWKRSSGIHPSRRKIGWLLDSFSRRFRLRNPQIPFRLHSPRYSYKTFICTYCSPLERHVKPMSWVSFDFRKQFPWIFRWFRFCEFLLYASSEQQLIFIVPFPCDK